MHLHILVIDQFGFIKIGLFIEIFEIHTKLEFALLILSFLL